MSFIPEEKIDEIRSRASIVSVLSPYVNLKKMGVNYKGLCPFHSEKTPSFVVSEVKKIYHCFGCGKGGNVFTFLMEHAGLSFPEAVQKLAQETGVLLPRVAMTEKQKETKEKKENLYKLNKNSLLLFKQELKKNKKAMEFLKKRGIEPQVIETYHLGYAPTGFFRNRLIFPLFDTSQRVIGFGGRSLDEKQMPKYLNSPESPIYHKAQVLYGLSKAIQSIGKDGVIVVEGYFDCLILHQAGFTNTIATMGTALSIHHVKILKHFTDQFFVFFDQDEAGYQAAEKSLGVFLEEGLFPRVIQLSQTFKEAKDPDDFIRKYGKESMKTALKNAGFLIDFVVERIISRLKGLAAYKTKVIEEVTPYLKQFPISIERDEMVRRLADRLQIEEKWILKSLGQGTKENPSIREVSKVSSYSPVEVEIIEFIMLFPVFLEIAPLEKVLDLLVDLDVKHLFSEMMKQYKDKQTIDFSSLLEKISAPLLKERLLKGVLEKENQGNSLEESKIDFHKCIQRLYKRHLENQEKSLLMKIRELDREHSESDVEEKRNRLLHQYQELVKQKQH